MRLTPSLPLRPCTLPAPLLAPLFAATLLVLHILSGPAAAADRAPLPAVPFDAPNPLDAQRPLAPLRPAPIATPRPSLYLDEHDRLATLAALDIALSSVGDGGAYAWHRGNGLLSGLFRPTASFRGPAGNVCRHIIIRLNSAGYVRQTEGIACRDDAGIWSLTG